MGPLGEGKGGQKGGRGANKRTLGDGSWELDALPEPVSNVPHLRLKKPNLMIPFPGVYCGSRTSGQQAFIAH